MAEGMIEVAGTVRFLSPLATSPLARTANRGAWPESSRFRRAMRGQKRQMAAIHVETARVVDRDELLRILGERGLDASAVDEDGQPGIEITCDGEPEAGCSELFAEVEGWIAETGLPLVPLQLKDRIFLRPPAD